MDLKLDSFKMSLYCWLVQIIPSLTSVRCQKGLWPTIMGVSTIFTEFSVCKSTLVFVYQYWCDENLELETVSISSEASSVTNKSEINGTLFVLHFLLISISEIRFVKQRSHHKIVLIFPFGFMSQVEWFKSIKKSKLCYQSIDLWSKICHYYQVI